MSVKKIKQGDMARLQFTIAKKSTKTPVDLTGTTVTLVMSGGYVYSKMTKTCVVNDPPTAGRCYYDLLAADTTNLAGKYRLELKINGIRNYTTLEDTALIVEEVL